MAWQEWSGAILGVVSVWALGNRWKWGFYVSFWASVLLVWVLFESRLYGDMIANLYFSAMSIDGALRWKTHEGQEAIKYLSLRQCLWVAISLVVFWLLWFWVFGLIEGRFAVASAGVVSLSLVGQWLLNRRFVENWWLWVLSNALSASMAWLSGLWAVGVLYVLYLFLAIKGLWQWLNPR